MCKFKSVIQALLIFDPLVTLWGYFNVPCLKLLSDASVASACSYIRTCRRVRNSKKIATIRDFYLPGSFFCLSTTLIHYTLEYSKCQTLGQICYEVTEVCHTDSPDRQLMWLLGANVTKNAAQTNYYQKMISRTITWNVGTNWLPAVKRKSRILGQSVHQVGLPCLFLPAKYAFCFIY